MRSYLVSESPGERLARGKAVQLVGTTHGNCLENLIKNPSLSDLIGGIGFPPPGIGGPGAELPEFPGFPGRPPIRPPTKPPFDPDTNTEKPEDGFDGIGPLITTTTDYPEDSPTTFSPPQFLPKNEPIPTIVLA